MKNRKPTGHEATWPPQPPWGRGEKSDYLGDVLALFLGIPVLIGTMGLILVEDFVGKLRVMWRKWSAPGPKR